VDQHVDPILPTNHSTEKNTFEDILEEFGRVISTRKANFSTTHARPQHEPSFGMRQANEVTFQEKHRAYGNRWSNVEGNEYTS